MRQLEGDLEEAAHTKDTLSQEVERLSLSLDQMKNRADGTAGQVTSHCHTLHLYTASPLDVKCRWLHKTSINLYMHRVYYGLSQVLVH